MTPLALESTIFTEMMAYIPSVMAESKCISSKLRNIVDAFQSARPVNLLSAYFDINNKPTAATRTDQHEYPSDSVNSHII